MDFIDELFENNSMYESISKQMDKVEYMYYKYITNSVGKFNKLKYNEGLLNRMKITRSVMNLLK